MYRPMLTATGVRRAGVDLVYSRKDPLHRHRDTGTRRPGGAAKCLSGQGLGAALLPRYRRRADAGDESRCMLANLARPPTPTAAAGRCPSTGGCRRLKIMTQSSPVATQLPHACGLAWAMRVKKEPGVVWVSFGDGVASKGDFHEGAQLRRDSQTAGGLLLREQLLRDLGAVFQTVARRAGVRPGRSLRHARGERRRQRRL